MDNLQQMIEGVLVLDACLDAASSHKSMLAISSQAKCCTYARTDPSLLIIHEALGEGGPSEKGSYPKKSAIFAVWEMVANVGGSPNSHRGHTTATSVRTLEGQEVGFDFMSTYFQRHHRHRWPILLM